MTERNLPNTSEKNNLLPFPRIALIMLFLFQYTPFT